MPRARRDNSVVAAAEALQALATNHTQDKLSISVA
jgi:hypothetical protein